LDLTREEGKEKKGKGDCTVGPHKDILEEGILCDVFKTRGIM
jgi:hypothetical protein